MKHAQTFGYTALWLIQLMGDMGVSKNNSVTLQMKERTTFW